MICRICRGLQETSPNQRCPRNGKWTVWDVVQRRSSNPLISQTTEAQCANTRLWEGGVGCSISPDTGQHSGCALQGTAITSTPAGRLVPGFCLCF